jgi:hypothetical protein
MQLAYATDKYLCIICYIRLINLRSMRFPSVKNLADNALLTIRRFPFEVLFALAGTIAATINIELSSLNREGQNWCMRTIMIANLGLLLSLSATLFIESKGITGSRKLLIRLAAVVISILLIFIINPGIRQADYIRFFLFSLSFHLLVAYAAFIVKGHVQGFWQFNKTLFLQFLTSALYSAALFLGLAAAIGAMNFLFNFKFESDTFFILWVWIVGMFSTIFFLSAIPKDFTGLDNDFSYPKGLKVFTQYVLIPLATVYVAILLAYELKILIQWQLPKGLVSNLILGYAVFGILSLLLVYPIREKEENKWLKTYSKSFYFLLIPLLILLFTAVGTRIFRYGITEMRYFLIVLACWLLFITIYFLIAKKQNIKFIPVSLSLLTLLSIYGPQSAFSVSEYSQRRILVEVFKKNNAFKDGKIMAVDSLKISRKDGHHAVATLDYLITRHDLTSLQPYFNEDLARVSDSLDKAKGKDLNRNYQLQYDKFDWAKKRLGLNRFTGYYRDGDDSTDVVDYLSYTFHTADNTITKVSGYDYTIDLTSVNDTTTYLSDGLSVKIQRSEKDFYVLTLNNNVLSFDLKALMSSLMKPDSLKTYTTDKNGLADTYLLPNDKLTLTQQNSKFKVTLLIDRISIAKSDKKNWKVNFMTGSYLIKKK